MTPPIPDQLARRPRDRRGYPIPFIVYRDEAGKPHFTINDEGLRQRAITENRCSLCGQPLTRYRWLVGGPASAFHPQGAYLDPPMHHVCVRWALEVCPYLAMPAYGKLIDGRTLDQGDPIHIGQDDAVLPDRPDVFVLVAATGLDYVMDPPWVRYIRPRRPFARLEYWRHGVQLTAAEGVALVAPELRPGTLEKVS